MPQVNCAVEAVGCFPANDSLFSFKETWSLIGPLFPTAKVIDCPSASSVNYGHANNATETGIRDM